MIFRVLAILCLATGASIAATPSVPVAGSPALSALGAFKVGRVKRQLAGDRKLELLIWYPAVPARNAKPADYSWTLSPAPPLGPRTVTFGAIAVEGSRAAHGRFPVAILSHGFGGAPQHMSYLGENLASKGYVVVAIDHGDQASTDAASFRRAFAQAVQFRAVDQQRAIAALEKPADLPLPPNIIIDLERIAVIGYSMGGFGALATAGAGYDPASVTVKSLPPGTLAAQLEGRPQDTRVKAVVAIAPWGAQAPFRSWSTAGAASLKLPLLLISGDQDDISNHVDGAKWFFDRATGSDRLFVVYRNARHNIGGNPLPTEAADSAGYREYFEDAVWRSDRLNALNQHFVTAFLDRHLRNDLSREPMLRSPLPGADWPGFPKRSAVGFDLEHKSARQ